MALRQAVKNLAGEIFVLHQVLEGGAVRSVSGHGSFPFCGPGLCSIPNRQIVRLEGRTPEARIAPKPQEGTGTTDAIATSTTISAVDDPIPSHWTCDYRTAALIYERFIDYIDKALVGQPMRRRILEFLDLRASANKLTFYMGDDDAREIVNKIDLDMQLSHAIIARRDDGAWYSVPRRFHFMRARRIILETVFFHINVIETGNGAAIEMRLGENEDLNSGSPFAASLQLFETDEPYVFDMQRPGTVTIRRRS